MIVVVMGSFGGMMNYGEIGDMEFGKVVSVDD